MQNDTLASALAAINNAEKIGRMTCTIRPVSRIIKTVLKIMQEKHYIGSWEEKADARGGSLVVHLLGKINICAAIKPRFPITMKEYEKFEKRFLPARDFGIIIVSTSQGMMSHADAKTKRLGGKMVSYCY
ncbi:MAG: 30S ribosomal protein S8 [Candidatus Woesearchaeota archaeon]|nr:30S ribosomal protein S8 [Candidatus Woesearchaeota archaeon]